MESHVKKMQYHRSIDEIKNGEQEFIFSSFLSLTIDICKDKDLNEMDTKDLITEISELL